MGAGHMLLTLGAIILLTFVILKFNSNSLITEDSIRNDQIGVLGISLATSLIEEASAKTFDENTDTNVVSSVNSLSSTLGPDYGQQYPNFNDFDDYNNFTRRDTIRMNNQRLAIFTLRSTVNYINPASPEVVSTSRTWHKKITVRVTSDMTRDTIRLSQFFSYWTFR